MIKIVYILFLCFVFNNINAKSDHLFELPQLPNLSICKNSSKEEALASVFNKKDLPTKNKILKEKKIRHRGIVTVFYLSNNNCPKLFDFYNKELFYSYQTIIFLRLFLDNKKRGPPAILLS